MRFPPARSGRIPKISIRPSFKKLREETGLAKGKKKVQEESGRFFVKKLRKKLL